MNELIPPDGWDGSPGKLVTTELCEMIERYKRNPTQKLAGEIIGVYWCTWDLHYPEIDGILKDMISSPFVFFLKKWSRKLCRLPLKRT